MRNPTLRHSPLLFLSTFLLSSKKYLLSLWILFIIGHLSLFSLACLISSKRHLFHLKYYSEILQHPHCSSAFFLLDMLDLDSFSQYLKIRTRLQRNFLDRSILPFLFIFLSNLFFAISDHFL